MTRKEWNEMCSETFDSAMQRLRSKLNNAQKSFGHNSDEYLTSFQALWEYYINSGYLSEYQIENIMETAKPHTQATKGLDTMAWLYDRLLHREIYQSNGESK